jgi:hypothetical protein
LSFPLLHAQATNDSLTTAENGSGNGFVGSCSVIDKPETHENAATINSCVAFVEGVVEGVIFGVVDMRKG